MKNSGTFIFVIFITTLLFSCGDQWEVIEKEDYHLVVNKGGQTLGYSPTSGVEIITSGPFAFKDLNKNGELDRYEDWRLDAENRAKDLANKMSVEQIAGLMLYSGHQAIPGGGYGGSTYGGKKFEESGALASDLTDQQIAFLTKENLRHVLVTRLESPVIAAKWNNNVQALVEGLGLGIPSNNSSDPRHEASSDEEYTLGAGGEISRWPSSIGLAATFDPELVKEFGTIASKEYRALGISTALSPQVDIASDPRWYRYSGTFGPDPNLTKDMGRAYIDGFQTSSKESEINGGWGFESVNAMAKHWPGGGSGEGGRDAHYGFGKFAVYPGNNFDSHLIPFVEGVFKLEGGTKMASAIMPYYTISLGQDPNGENVGNSFNKYIISDLLRGKYGYDGVICTDWGVTTDDVGMAVFGRTPWGVEHLTEVERHYKILMAGCDQFGGNNNAGPVIEAYQMGVKEHGEEFMRERMEQSAVRLLKNIFRVGLFENPYLDVEETRETVGKPEFMDKGYEAQLKSLVLLKNDDVLPLKTSDKVYFPKKYFPATVGFFGPGTPEKVDFAIDTALFDRYFSRTNSPEDASVAILVIDSPKNGRTAGYSAEDVAKGGNGFLPISLQYNDYTASTARAESIGGDSRPQDVLNRSYKDKTVTVSNKADLELIINTKIVMGDKPVIVVLKTGNPTVVAEFESLVNGLIIDFNVSDQALLDIISGKTEPSGLLPMQMPASMETVEQQFEDVPLDMEVHMDTKGNKYDFGFGMNWSGIIDDGRTTRYKK